jgi:hypothetical protein
MGGTYFGKVNNKIAHKKIASTQIPIIPLKYHPQNQKKNKT